MQQEVEECQQQQQQQHTWHHHPTAAAAVSGQPPRTQFQTSPGRLLGASEAPPRRWGQRPNGVAAVGVGGVGARDFLPGEAAYAPPPGVMMGIMNLPRSCSPGGQTTTPKTAL